MLTVMHLKNSAEAISNYLKNGLPDTDDATDALAAYYGADGEACFWVGRLADDLDLTGQPVAEETFKGMLEGALPDGTTPAQLHDRNRRLGEDFTFSAPKSVSIAVLALGKTELIEDHHAAVVEALEFVQEHLLFARRGKQGVEREYGPRVAIAAFNHFDARPVNGVIAPDLHTHCVVPNIGKRADGTLGGVKIDMGERGDLIKMAGAIYRAKLAELLQRRKIALRPTENGFELASIDDETIRAWSPRKRQIDAALAQRGKTRSESTAAEKQWANLFTRESKQDMPLEEHIKHWRRIAHEDGLTVAHDISLNKPKPAPEELAFNALAHLAEREAVFRIPALQAQALLLGCAFHDRATMERAVQSVVNQYGIALEGDRLTTYRHAASAEYIRAFAKATCGTAAPLADQDKLPAFLAAQEARQGFAFSGDQREALTQILSSQDGIQCLVGAAGSGKTTALALVAQAAKDAGLQVVGLAPSHVAKDALAGSLGIESETLAKWLQAPPAAKGPRLIIVDESGLVGTQDMAALFASLTPQDRVLLVGDPRQLQPVAAGTPFADLLADRLDTPTLGEIRRQHDAEQRRIATLYSMGKGQEAAEALLNFTHAVDSEVLIQSAASAYRATSGSKVLLASKRSTVDSLNAEVSRLIHCDTPPMAAVATARKIPATKAERERMSFYPVGRTLAKRGEVRRVERVDGDKIVTNRNEIIERPWEKGWDACDVSELALWQGDQLLAVDTFELTIEGKPVKVRNGTELVVVGKADDGGVILQLPDGRKGATNPRSAVPVQYGYARTVHKSQGATVDHAIVVDDGVTGASLGYVMTSRQRTSLAIFTSDKGSLSDRLSTWAQHAPITPTQASADKLAAARQEGAAYARRQAMPRQQAAEARRAAMAAAEAEQQAKIEAERQARIEAERQQAEAARQATQQPTTRQAETVQVEAPQPVYWGRRP